MMDEAEADKRPFRRGLSQGARASLAELASSETDNWWKDLLALWGPSGTGKAERPLRLTIRDNYLNFYFRGQSVARVAFDGQDRPFVDVHVKYAFAGATEQTYARLTDQAFVDRSSGQTAPYAGAATLWQWMARAAGWEGAEKSEVERIVADNGAVIDLEMGLPAHGDRKSALRMDLIALEQTQDQVGIVFWEAKRITDARLRAGPGGVPEVIAQIEAYRAYLADEDRRAAVIEAYGDTCRLLIDFARWAGRGGGPLVLDPLIHQAAKAPEALVLDVTPRLVILGAEEQLAAPGWQSHLARLTKHHGVTALTIKTDAYRLDSPAAEAAA